MTESNVTLPEVGTPERPFFAVVVGTGFGGAVTACRLAQAAKAVNEDAPPNQHKRICVLERGRRYEASDFPRLGWPEYVAGGETPDATSKRVPDIARLLWKNDQGLWDVRNLGELRVAQAAGYGGGSLVYANVHLRPPNKMFERWPTRCASDQCACAPHAPRPLDRDGLGPYFDRVTEMLDARPLPEALRTKYPKTRAMAAVATATGAAGPARFIYPPLAVTFDAPSSGKNRFGRPQSACTGCGNCSIGCQEGAKNTLDRNYLAVAETLDVEVRTLCEVETIKPANDEKSALLNGKSALLRVAYVDHLCAEAREVWAEHVFLCAGAMNSTEILLRSADKPLEAPGRPSGSRVTTLDKPDRLGSRFFANGDAMGVAFDTKDDLRPQDGPTITASITYGDDPWFLLQDGGIPPSLMWALGLFKSPLLFARNRFMPPSRLKTRILGRLGQLAQRAPAYWRGDVTPSATTALGRAARALVPEALAGLANELAKVDVLLAKELDVTVKGITKAIDTVLSDSRLGRMLVAGRKRYVPHHELKKVTHDTLVARYPALRDLLHSKRTRDWVLAAIRFLVLGEGVSTRTMMFLCMGPDQPGKLHLRNDHLRIAWERDNPNRGLYTLQERVMRDAAAALDGELRTNPDWTVGTKPTTVHAQGGCGIGATPETGVVTPCGRLWTNERLYVMDGGSLPNSVGVNPSATIAAVAERNIELFIRRELPGAGDYLSKGFEPSATRGSTFDQELPGEIPVSGREPAAQPVGFRWTEEMHGPVAEAAEVNADVVRSLQDDHLKARTNIDRRYMANVCRWARTKGYDATARLGNLGPRHRPGDAGGVPDDDGYRNGDCVR